MLNNRVGQGIAADRRSHASSVPSSEVEYGRSGAIQPSPPSDLVDLRVVAPRTTPPEVAWPELREWLRSVDSGSKVLLVADRRAIEAIVNAVSAGAAGSPGVPLLLLDPAQLGSTVFAGGPEPKQSRKARSVLPCPPVPVRIVAGSEPMREVLRLVERIGASDARVLIQGESGTGKDLVARALAEAGSRAGKPLVTVNCGAIPEELAESELFGHEKGAFTGATAARLGLFEIADGGTLFIDEIGELPLSLQPKLLRVLEEGWIRRVGSSREQRVDVRVIAATNRDLAADVAARRFREDLYFRLNVMSIELPPLRDRPGDVLLLARYFLGSGWNLDPHVCQVLERYRWPGNVRELSNVLKRATVLAESSMVTLDDLPAELVEAALESAAPATEAIDPRLAALERAHVLRVLEEYHGNKARTARMLGIHRRTLYRLLDRFGIGAEL
jgi:DNA-binding NtrC family response regulator